jgi:predicted transcriptional regulator
MHRTQIYLADDQEQALATRARQVGRTKSALIREAIDSYLAPVPTEQAALSRLRAAVANASGVAPYLPPGEHYAEDLRAADRERERELDERRSR